ncbi:MAG TPA: alpha/beta hydrolase [Nevskiaceae bacterium]|nr:alpha/beta hydrolase [Nevskiaceae bacterium]
MDTRAFFIKVESGPELGLRAWLPAAAPRALLLIIHGMSEHGGRYARFAAEAVAAGHAVYALDLPGHGRTARAPDERGHFASEDGWNLALQCIQAADQAVRERHPGRPLFLFGHSMGSFLLQHYLVQAGGHLAGAILSATTGDLGPLRRVALTLLRAEQLWLGARHRSRLAEQLTFGEFNRKVKVRGQPSRTPFDWLSRDPAEVDRYLADPCCGFRCSVSLWISLLEACGQLLDRERLRRLPARLPVLLIAGEADPVCQGSRGPRILQRAYHQAGLGDVSARFYPGARHELLNETCREQVTRDLLDWLASRSGTGSP